MASVLPHFVRNWETPVCLWYEVSTGMATVKKDFLVGLGYTVTRNFILGEKKFKQIGFRISWSSQNHGLAGMKLIATSTTTSTMPYAQVGRVQAKLYSLRCHKTNKTGELRKVSLFLRSPTARFVQ